MISIIIPTLKVEKEFLNLQLTHLLKENEDFEIIFSDGEREVFVQQYGTMISEILIGKGIHYTIVDNPHGHSILTRAESMNLGAKKAHGDVLLFLHLDIFLPSDGLQRIAEAMTNHDIIGGGFLKAYDRPFAFRLTEKLLNYRTSYFKRMVGTNAMFLKKEIYDLNPFPEQFMEDVALSDQLIQRYSKDRIAIIPEYVRVSSIKYRKHGSLKRILINALIMFLYRVGRVKPSPLESLYKRGQKDSILRICLKGCQLLWTRGGSCSS